MTRPSLALAGAAALLLLTPPASAASRGVTDLAGDAGGGLDLTRASVTNGERTLTARVAFSRLTGGDLIVSVDRRNGSGLRLVSEYRPRGETRSYVLRGAFTDTGGEGGRVTCPGFRVTWDTAARSATLNLPARCLAGGRYADVRFAVLTEAASGGADADFAPETPDGDLGNSRWIPRG